MDSKMFIRAILAGFYIGIAGVVYLSVENKVLGSLLFSSGLLLVVTKDYYLYTGKAGYLIPYEKGYLKVLLKTILGNIIGISTVGFLYLLTKNNDIMFHTETIIQAKLNKDIFISFVLAIFCGMLMYTGVEGYKKIEHKQIKMLIVIFAVMIFILSGFEHSIANMLYIIIGKAFTWKALLYLVVWILGNLVGAVFLNILEVYK